MRNFSLVVLAIGLAHSAFAQSLNEAFRVGDLFDQQASAGVRPFTLGGRTSFVVVRPGVVLTDGPTRYMAKALVYMLPRDPRGPGLTILGLNYAHMETGGTNFDTVGFSLAQVVVNTPDGFSAVPAVAFSDTSNSGQKFTAVGTLSQVIDPKSSLELSGSVIYLDVQPDGGGSINGLLAEFDLTYPLGSGSPTFIGTYSLPSREFGEYGWEILGIFPLGKDGTKSLRAAVARDNVYTIELAFKF
jgi:hypothetical protein